MEDVSGEMEAELRMHKHRETSTTSPKLHQLGWVVGECCQKAGVNLITTCFLVYLCLQVQEENKSLCMCVELCIYLCRMPPGTSTENISLTGVDGVQTLFDEGLFLLGQTPAHL